MDTIKILNSHTDKLSTLCRSIVYALIATTWLLFSHALDNALVITTFILLIAYLFFDICQYLSTVVIAFALYWKGRKKGVTMDYLNNQEEKIDWMSYSIFFLKMLILVSAFVLLIISIIHAKNMLLTKF